MPDDRPILEALQHVSSATVTTILLKQGLRNVWMRGTRPIRPDQPRLVGCVFTLRFVPAREDLATPESWASPRSTRAAIEDLPEGCTAVVEVEQVGLAHQRAARQDKGGVCVQPLDLATKRGRERFAMDHAIHGRELVDAGQGQATG